MAESVRVDVAKESHAIAKKAAQKRGVTITSYVSDLIAEIGIADKEAKIILSIPLSLLKKNEAALRDWLKVRMDAIVSAYYPGK